MTSPDAEPPAGAPADPGTESPGTADRIAAAALAILEAEGPDAVSMRRIARTLGITPMAIYHHYKDREALLQAVAYMELGKLGALGDRLVASRGHDADLAGTVDAYLDYAFARPHMFDYMFTARRVHACRYPEGFRARRSPTMTPVADRVAEAMASGELKSHDVWEVAMQFWAHVHGYVTMYRTGWFNLDEKQFRALYHRAAQRLVEGLRK